MRVLRLAFLFTSSVHSNSRALRQLSALDSEGFACYVYSVRTAAAAANPPAEFVETTVQVHPSRGPAFFWAAHRALSRAVRAIPPDQNLVVHASDLYSLPAAKALARRTGAPLTYDARELYPFVSATVGRPWVSHFWRRLESHFIRSCNAVFTVNDSIADRIASQYKVPRPVVVENVPALRSVEPSNLLRSALGAHNDQPVVLHQGHLRNDRGCDLLVQAAAAVPDAHFVFLGSGPLRDSLETLAQSLQVRNRIHFLDPVAPDELLDYTASATVGVTLLEDTCLNHHFALPNKLFEYLMAGIPVLASDLPEIRRVVAGYEVGRLVTPGSVDDTARNLRELLSASEEIAACRENTRRVFETINWERASERFLNEFRRLRQPLS